MQRVRSPSGLLLSKGGALAHAEAVLLVDHGDGERGEDDVGLDQRMRADDHRQLAVGQLAEDVFALAGRRGAGEQLAGQRLVAHQLLDRREVLFGKRLGRRHQCRLALMLDRSQHRVQRHDRLAAADLPHQQPLHRPRLAQVRVDRVDRRELVAGRLERQAVQPPPAQPRLAVQPVRAGSRPPPRAAAQERELREQQLLEGQPAPPRLEVLETPPAAWRCPWCKGSRFWRSLYGAEISVRYHPPVDQRLVQEWLGEFV